jgi:hypothetical protein
VSGFRNNSVEWPRLITELRDEVVELRRIARIYEDALEDISEGDCDDAVERANEALNHYDGKVQDIRGWGFLQDRDPGDETTYPEEAA